MPAQFVHACEISSRAVVTARFCRLGTRLVCDGVWKRELRGESTDEWTTELPRVLTELSKTALIRRPVRVALAGPLVLTRVLSVPILRRRARERVVRFEAGQALPYPREEYLWASGRVDPACNEVLWIAAARRDVVEAVFAASETANVEVASIEPAPLVLLRRLDDEAIGAGPRGLVHAHAEGVDVAIIDGERSLVRSVAIEATDVYPADGVEDERIEERNTRIARVRQEVSRTLAHHRRNGGTPIAHLHVVAPGEMRPALLDALRHDHDDGVLVPLSADFGVEAAGDEGAATCSAVLRACASEPDRPARVNLAPLRLVRRARWRRAHPWLQATAAVLAVALVMPLLDAHERRKQAGRELANLEHASAEQRYIEQRWANERQSVEQARMRVTQLERLVSTRVGWVRLLNELQEITQPGEGIWIESLQPLATEPGPVRPSTSRRLFGSDKAETSGPAEAAGAGAAYLLVACVLEPSGQASGDAVFRRARTWLDRMGECPQVIAIEHERFEPDPSGLLRVKVVVRFDSTVGGATG